MHRQANFAVPIAALVLFTGLICRPADGQGMYEPQRARGIEIDVCSFGAVPDGQTDSTVAIEKATQLANSTGGTVKFPPGAGSYIYRGGPITVGTPTNKVDWILEGSDIRVSSAADQDFILLENYSGVFGYGSTWGKSSITVDRSARLRTVIRNARQGPGQQEAAYIEGVSVNGQSGAQISGAAAVDLSYLYVPSMIRDSAITNFNATNLRIANAGVFLLDNVLAQGCGATYAEVCPASRALVLSDDSDATSLGGTYQGSSAGLPIVTITDSDSVNFYSTYYEAGRRSGPSLLIEDSQNVHLDGHLCGGYTDGDCIQIGQTRSERTGTIRITNARTNGPYQKLVNNTITGEMVTADGGFGHSSGDYTFEVREHGNHFVVADSPPAMMTGSEHGALTVFNHNPDGHHFACFDFSVANAGRSEGDPVSRICQENGGAGTTLHFLTSNDGSKGVTTDVMQLHPNGDATISGSLFLAPKNGSAPLKVTSTVLNENLNADLLGGHPAADFMAAPSAPPRNSSSSCSAGQWAYTSDYLYICVTRNSWRRAPRPVLDDRRMRHALRIVAFRCGEFCPPVVSVAVVATIAAFIPARRAAKSIP